MNITTKGVELDSEELIRFFEGRAEISTITLCDKNGLVMGDVIAITKDDRMVLDVDIPATGELYSDTFRYVRVVAETNTKFNLTIIN